MVVGQLRTVSPRRRPATMNTAWRITVRSLFAVFDFWMAGRNLDSGP